ncbi:hypothetical protein M408DRAFT_66400 [Serendipita vermifera MAFF 305830]|uniref:Uncharacterized protein n=1 Tax=Serendipita vermifera MAFF 305830 TaxID=933852 RepID=A0A0C3BET2_SERVB|nr:hypothetical protein M408DRAFT_66400 [Serendipita vermifera MAFF 305830]
MTDSTTQIRQDRRNFAIGIFLLLIVVFLWTSSNFITQVRTVEGFDKPFLVTYLNTSSFAIYLIPSLYRYLRRNSKSQDLPYDYQPPEPEPEPARASSDDDLPPLTTRETASLASTFCVLWFIANWTVNASFRYTSVGSATVLASTSGFFTMVVGRILGIERLTSWKVGAVVTSFVGVVLVSFADAGRPPTKTPPPPSSALLPPPSNPLLGDFLALLSALFYALYMLLLKVRIKVESRVDMQLLFGFVGLFNIVGCWPLGLVLHLTGVERFGWPVGGKEWSGVLINMAVTFSSDFIYVVAMLKTTPLVVTLGLTLTIPLAIIGDYFLQSRAATLLGLFGATLVVAAFGVIGWGDSRPGATQPVEPLLEVNEEEDARV